MLFSSMLAEAGSEVTITRKDLYELVWARPMSALAKEYAISDVGLRKVCKRLNVSIPQRGHWNKLHAGKKVVKASFEDHFEGEQTVSLKLRKDGEPTAAAIQKDLQMSIVKDKNVNVRVSDRLVAPHPLVLAAKQDLAEKHKDWQFKGMIFTKRGTLSIRATPALADRALRFMDTIIKALVARGHSVTVDESGSYLTMEGRHKTEIGCRETSKRVSKNGTWNTADFEPNGILAFKVGYIEWKDSKTKRLEEQIPAILAKLEYETARLLAIWADSERREEERREQERIELESEEKQVAELASFKQLLSEANRWHQADILRKFLESLREGKNNSEREEWLTWAENKLAWYDPAISDKDNLLENVEMESLTLRKESKKFAW